MDFITCNLYNWCILSLGLGFILSFANLLISLKNGEKAGKNPWKATTLDWQTQSPPITENFEDIIKLEKDPYEYN